MEVVVAPAALFYSISERKKKRRSDWLSLDEMPPLAVHPASVDRRAGGGGQFGYEEEEARVRVRKGMDREPGSL